MIQATVLHLTNLRMQGIPVSFYQISFYKDIKRNKEAHIAAKNATGWKRVKKKNWKWKK